MNFILSLGAIISIFSVIIFNIEKIISSKNLLSLFSNNLSIYFQESWQSTCDGLFH